MMNSSTFNDTEMGLEFFGDEEKIEELIAQDAANSLFRYVMFTTGIFLFLVPIIGSAVVCYTVFKFSAFRTRTNYLLVNFFITSCLFSVFVGLQLCIESVSHVYYYFMNFFFLIQVALFGATCLLTILLAFDWYSSAHWHGIFAKFAKYYKWIVGSLHLVIFVVFLFTLRSSVVTAVFLYFDILTYLTSLITIIAWNVMRLRRTYTTETMKTYYAFASATTYVLMWVPLIFALFLQFVIYSYTHAEDWYRVIDRIMLFLIHILICSAIASPALIAFLLARWDAQFRMGFAHLLKRKFARSNDLDGHVAYVNYTSSECFEEDVKLS